MPLNALLVIGIAVGSQLLIRPNVPVASPATVVQLSAGLALGPSGVGLLHVDVAVRVLAATGMAYLLFTAGTELDRRMRAGHERTRALAAFGASGILAGCGAVAISAISGLRDVPLIAVALLTTLVMPSIVVLGANGRRGDELSDFTILAGTLGGAGAIAVILVSAISGAPVVSTAVLCLLVGGAVSTLRPRSAITPSVGTGRPPVRVLGRSAAPGNWLALSVIATLAALVPLLGEEPLLAAYGAGLVWSSRCRTLASWIPLRRRLDGVGLAVLAPMAFVSAGARIDVAAILRSPRDIALVPTLLLAMLVCRALPARLFAPRASDLRERHAAGLLLATKLTVVVVAVQLARAQGMLPSGAGSALLLSAEVTVCAFPAVAALLLARSQQQAVQNRLVLLDTHPCRAAGPGDLIVKQHCT